MEYNLIADAGSTKTDWILADDNGVELKRFSTSGLNATLARKPTAVALMTEVRNILSQCVKPDHIYYYGAGCATPATCRKMEKVIRHVLQVDDINVASDMLGAARALFGHEAGIACILGTGSNSCLYDGNKIVESVPSLGYILGDEGSGAAIGRRFLSDYIKGHMPVWIKETYLNKMNFNPDIGEVLSNVYRNPSPSRYLASFVPFVKRIEDTLYASTMLRNEFERFISYNVARYSAYREKKLRFAGSIAETFIYSLKKAVEKFNLRIDKVVAHPLDSLLAYHSKAHENDK